MCVEVRRKGEGKKNSKISVGNERDFVCLSFLESALNWIFSHIYGSIIKRPVREAGLKGRTRASERLQKEFIMLAERH